MQQVFATLLAAVFSAMLIAPGAFASHPGSTLPACCRKGGKHQCALAAENASAAKPDAPAFRGSVEHCPFSANLRSTSGESSFDSPLPVLAVNLVFPAEERIVGPNQQRFFAVPRFAEQKRGPPPLKS